MSKSKKPFKAKKTDKVWIIVDSEDRPVEKPNGNGKLPFYRSEERATKIARIIGFEPIKPGVH